MEKYENNDVRGSLVIGDETSVVTLIGGETAMMRSRLSFEEVMDLNQKLGNGETAKALQKVIVSWTVRGPDGELAPIDERTILSLDHLAVAPMVNALDKLFRLPKAPSAESGSPSEGAVGDARS